MAQSFDIKPPDYLAQLPQAPASDVKKLGWRGLMKTVRSGGKLVVTNHDAPEAVIMSVEEYSDLMQAARQTAAQTESALSALRQRFDQRLAALQSPDAGDRLRNVMAAGAHLDGKVKVGTSY